MYNPVGGPTIGGPTMGVSPLGAGNVPTYNAPMQTFAAPDNRITVGAPSMPTYYAQSNCPVKLTRPVKLPSQIDMLGQIAQSKFFGK